MKINSCVIEFVTKYSQSGREKIKEEVEEKRRKDATLNVTNAFCIFVIFCKIK